MSLNPYNQIYLIPFKLINQVSNGFLNHPELFIKIADVIFKKTNNLFYHRHFLPFRRADFTASALLQRIRSEIPQLHPLRLASAATSTRE
jgi:hypothetical protein